MTGSGSNLVEGSGLEGLGRRGLGRLGRRDIGLRVVAKSGCRASPSSWVILAGGPAT